MRCWYCVVGNVQAAADAIDKRLYYLMKQAFGYKNSTLLSKNSSTLFTKSTDIASLWMKHFSEILNHESIVHETCIKDLSLAL